MRLCLICGADGRKRCNLVTHVEDVKRSERERASYILQVEANKYPVGSEAHDALLEALHSLEWSHR